MILYCCADLLWATKVKSTADALGIPARPARNLDMLNARLSDCDVRGLIVDLESGPVAVELIRAVRGTAKATTETPRHGEEMAEGGVGGGIERSVPGRNIGRVHQIPIIAFGPHVEVDALRAAATAGATEVMTRGAFGAGLADVLKRIGG